MKTFIIKIGNSKGVRIPKKFLEEANLVNEAEIEIKDGGIFIKPTPILSAKEIRTAWGSSYSAFAKEWNTPEEDAAWACIVPKRETRQGVDC